MEGAPAIELRPLEVADMDHIREFHREWFPVRYTDTFYDGVVKGNYKGREVMSRVAVDRGDLDEETGAARIVGCVIVSKSQAAAGERDLVSDAGRHPLMLYIMTIGVDRGCRRRGVGSVLLGWCMEVAEGQAQYGAVYLHVITHNEEALSFYARNGFAKHRRIRDYYFIDGRNYDCFVFYRNTNGATPAKGASWAEQLAGSVAWLQATVVGFATLLTDFYASFVSMGPQHTYLQGAEPTASL